MGQFEKCMFCDLLSKLLTNVYDKVIINIHRYIGQFHTLMRSIHLFSLTHRHTNTPTQIYFCSVDTYCVTSWLLSEHSALIVSNITFLQMLWPNFNKQSCFRVTMCITSSQICSFFLNYTLYIMASHKNQEGVNFETFHEVRPSGSEQPLTVNGIPTCCIYGIDFGAMLYKELSTI